MNSTKLHWLFRGGGGQFALIRGVCFMKILGAVVLTLLVLLPARWQPSMTAGYSSKTEKVVDASGNLRVPGGKGLDLIGSCFQSRLIAQC